MHMQCDEHKATIKKFINGRTQHNNAFWGGEVYSRISTYTNKKHMFMASSSKLESSPSVPLPLPATQREDRLRVRVLTKGLGRGFLLILILRSAVGGGYTKGMLTGSPLMS